MPEPDTRFDGMRPYRDEEVASVLRGLLADAEFLDVFAAYRMPRTARLAPALARRRAAAQLRRLWSGLNTVWDCQLSFKPQLERMLEETVTALSWSGLERLDPDAACLFVSNHRDIVLDPACVNYSLHMAGFPTVRIAIGENLLKRRYVADLMRLNKSFMVPRTRAGGRSRMQNYRMLKRVSEYIRHSVTEEGQSVWLAQREGRAKDGKDRTSEALVKMLAMSGQRGHALRSSLSALRIVPVAIAYELDPCDALKAKELCERDSCGAYAKADSEDDLSMAASITGQKGRVHVGYGEPLRVTQDSPAAVAREIDCAIVANYRLWPTAHFASRLLAGEDVPAEGAGFAERIRAMPERHRRYALAMYANPLLAAKPSRAA